MFCNNCGNKLENGAPFCNQCGSSNAPAPTQGGQQASASATSAGVDIAGLKTPRKKPPKKQLIIGGIAAVVIIVLAITLPVVLGGNKKLSGSANELKFHQGGFSMNSSDSYNARNKGEGIFETLDYATVDPKDVEWLQITNMKSADLKALRYCTNLRYLTIQWSAADKKPGTLDLSPLKDLKNLESLSISGSTYDAGPYKIDSLAPLRGLDNLVSLDFNYCTITNLSGLEELTRLRFLGINDSDSMATWSAKVSIKDYSPLYELNNLGRMNSALQELMEWQHAPTKLRLGTLYGLWIENANFSDHYETMREKLPDANIMPPVGYR